MSDSVPSGQRSEKELFFEALEKPTPQERAAFLDRACGRHPVLRAKVEALLADHFHADTFMVAPAVEASQATLPAPPPASEAPTQMLGRYKLLEQIGEGGFGEVWMAEQREPVKRRVALKIIKLGMDSKQVVARFEAERQALAMMDHANIAKIFDANVTDTGRPYFVMELVRGIKITEYCDQNQLPTKDRLDLFIKVCQAIQHAHQKGIIHRDIKPSNILVTLHDGVPVPKVIDFGIAKATQQELTDKTVFTQFQQFIGTPAYISPEQAEMSGLDIDTRADIYSLGVLLYELLVGQTPFDAKEMMKGGLDALRRIIREKEALRPSTKLKTLLGDDLTSTAQRRHTDPSHLSHQLRGDLDWIVMKCLEKDRTRRYDTATGLAMDIQRHLANEPVVARPPSTVYKIQKALQRNKLAFTAGATVAVALLVGIGVSSWQAVRATRARAVALEQKFLAQTQQQKAEAEQQRADREASSATAANAEAQRTAYAARMLLAQAAWEQGNISQVRALLAETESFPGRGFEWDYWQRQCRLDRLTIRNKTGVQSVAYSADGRRIATGSTDTITVWEADTGRELFSMPFENANWIVSIAFSPDGRRIVGSNAAWDFGKVGVWDAQTGRRLAIFRVRRTAFVAFSADSRRILHATGDATVLGVWDAETGQPVGETIEGFPVAPDWRKSVGVAAFSHDGRRIVGGMGDGTVKVLDLETRRELFAASAAPSPDFPQDGVRAVHFSPDGRRIVGGFGSGSIVVWDAETGQPTLTRRELHRRGVKSVLFSPDGRSVASAGAEGAIRVWDPENGRDLLALKGHEGECREVAFSPDGKRLVSVGVDATTRVWDLDPNRELFTLKPHSNFVAEIVFSPDGRRLITYDWKGRNSILWEADPVRPLLTIPEFGLPTAFTPDGRKVLGVVPKRDDPDEWHVESTPVLFNVETGRIETRFECPGTKWCWKLSPDGRRVAIGFHDGNVLMFDAGTGGQLLSFKAHESDVSHLAFSPDGRRMVTGCGLRFQKNPVKMWDAETGRPLHESKSPPSGEARRGHGGVSSIAFSPDGRRVVSGDHRYIADVWDADTGTLLYSLKGHSQWITDVDFTPDGLRVVTGSGDGTIKLWDAESGREVLNLQHPRPVHSFAIPADGRRIVSGDAGGKLAFWSIAEPGQGSRWLREEREIQARREKEEDARIAAQGDRPPAELAAQKWPLTPGDPGVIRQWLVLAPLPMEGVGELDSLRQQVPDEARLRPRHGDRPASAPTGLSWTAVRLGEDSYQLDFVKLAREAKPEADTDYQVAIAVAYVMSDTPQTGVMLLVGSDDTARIYLNEKEIYRHLDLRGYSVDGDQVTGVELKAGLNVLVFKVANGTVGWSGSVRLLDAQGQPLKGIHVTLDPDTDK